MHGRKNINNITRMNFIQLSSNLPAKMISELSGVPLMYGWTLYKPKTL